MYLKRPQAAGLRVIHLSRRKQLNDSYKSVKFHLHRKDMCRQKQRSQVNRAQYNSSVFVLVTIMDRREHLFNGPDVVPANSGISL